MRVFLRRFLLIALMLVLCSGCAFFSTRGQNDSEVNGAERNEVINAEKLLADGRFEEARLLFKEFQGRHPMSFFFQSARLGEAQALQGLGHYKEAADLYREVNLATIQYQPEIAALAWYQMSFAYESLGEDSKAVAALLDAQKFGQYLSAPVALAEIPARLAVVHGRQGHDEEALKYLNQADRGISKISSDKSLQLKKDWIGKTYVQMGSISMNQISSENFEEFVLSQKWVQIYLIKAMHLDDATWSSQAQKKLQETYRDLFNLFASVRDNRDLQKSMGGDLFDLIDQAELYKPLADQKINSYEAAFFTYLAEIRKKTESHLYKMDPIMGLTEESERLNSIKRPGRVKVDSLLPEQKKSSISYPPKVVPSEDPNL